MLRVFSATFFHVNRAKVLRIDRTLYNIMAYLTFFRLDELTFSELKQLIKSQDAQKMLYFLQFVFNPDTVKEWLYDEWCNIMDRSYVDNEIIDRLKRFKPQADKLIDKLRQQTLTVEDGAASGTTIPDAIKLNKKPPTIPKPFKLTKPKPRLLPEPFKIPQEKFANKAPDFSNTSLKEIEDTKRARREAIKKELDEDFKKAEQFKFHESKPSKTYIQMLIDKQEDEEKLEAGFNMKHVHPVPKMDENISVRVNAAAILREDALIRKRQEAEMKLLKDYQENLRDSSEFDRWQQEMRDKDEAARLQAVEERRSAMAAAQMEALMAMEEKLEENHRNALKLKQKSVEDNIKIKKRKEKELIVKQENADEIKQIRETAPREAEKKVLKEKVKIRNELVEESNRLLEKKKKEEEIEKVKRDDLIRQIRALELAPVEKVSMYDPTEVAGYGFLDEMSLQELRERLDILKVRRKQEEERRREEILKTQEEKQKELEDRIVMIKKERESKQLAKNKTRQRIKEEKERKEREIQEIRERNNLMLAERLKKQRQAKLANLQKLKEEEALLAKKRMFLGAAKSMMEERRFNDQRKGAEREAFNRQDMAQLEADTEGQTKLLEQYERKKNGIQQIQVKKQINKKREIENQNDLKAMRGRERDNKLTRYNMTTTERILETTQLQSRKESAPYTTMISTKDVTMGKEYTKSLRRTSSIKSAGESILNPEMV